MRRVGFTMVELIFVIVIMGILSKFGIEFLSQAYNNFIFSSINNTLQANSSAAVEGIASRLQFRIKDSIIARQPGVTYQALASSTLADNATILEWVGTDIEGLRGDSQALWSGIIDLNASTSTLLNTPETNTTSISNLIATLSNGGSTLNNAAIYFVGSDSNILTGYGYGGAITDQSGTMHPINSPADNFLTPVHGATLAANNFNGQDVYEYYQLAWTAYAVVHNTATGDLTLHYDYQPWAGDTYLLKANGDDTKSDLLMENVSTFRFKAVGSVVKIQVCVNTDIVEDYSLCKEKTIY